MRLLSLNSLTPNDVHRWEDLAAHASEPNPFFEAGFASIAARTLGCGAVHLLVEDAGGGGAWTGCLPVRAMPTAGTPRLLSSWRHPYSFLGTPLVDRDRVDEFSHALAQEASAERGRRLIVLRRCSVGVVLAAIRKAIALVPRAAIVFEHVDQRAFLLQRASADYLDSMRPHHRREMRRLRRRLADAFDAEPTVHDRADDPGAVDEFLRLEASGWKGREGTAMGQNAPSAAFFRGVCAELASQGRLQMLAMEAGGQTVAMKCNISAGDTLFCFKIAFDEELKRYSPGIQLEIENVNLFHARPESQMDSCAEPTNEMINRLWPERHPIATLALGPSGPSGWLAGRALDAAYAIHTRRTTP
jgi:CelD/BcsL family acetyltransferase involved in cellulose biosynthesis